MLHDCIENQKIELAQALIQTHQRFVMVCHISPDGDAIGSTLGFYHLLKALGKEGRVVTPDALPRDIAFLPESDTIVNFSSDTADAKQLIAQAEVLVCFDFNCSKRLGDEMANEVLQASGKKMMIDHHLYPDTFCDLSISYPEYSSTCELLYQVIRQMELTDKVTQSCAECIYTGMMTDTGNFTYNSMRPGIYRTIADLLEKGVNKDYIYDRLFKRNSESKVRINGYAVDQKMQLFPQYQAALISLDTEELKRYNYQKGDTEGLVNAPLGIRGIQFSVFFRQEKEFVKVSLRSKGSFPVNRIAENHFNGGGHLNAAGGEFFGTMAEAIALFVEILPSYSCYLENK